MKLERIEHPLASQRVKGEGALDVRFDGRRTRVERLYQQGAAKIRLPERDGDPLEAVLINTAGGLTGGDRLSWRLSVAEGASAVFTTQACEKVYRSAGGHAEQRTTIRAGDGSRIAWMPQETILFDRADLRRSLDIELGAGATALVVESVIFGRRSMGETVRLAAYRDRWRIRSGGRLLHAEDFAISGDVAQLLERRAIAHGGGAMATVLLLGPDAGGSLDAARGIVGDAGSASAWTTSGFDADFGAGKLLARLVEADGYALRRRLVPLLELLNGRAGLPKVWSL